MLIKRIVAGIYAANCYLVIDEDTKQGIVLDPGGDVDDILKEINKLKADIKYIFLTHGHLDHTSGVQELTTSLGNIAVAISEEDNYLINSGTHLYGPLLQSKKPDIYLKDGDTYKFGSLTLTCTATPGHTPGGFCFLIEDNLFTGDTLFYNSIGRTDLEGGNTKDLMDSLSSKIKILSDKINVYPGHGRQTTLGQEKTNNPYLKTI